MRRIPPPPLLMMFAFVLSVVGCSEGRHDDQLDSDVQTLHEEAVALGRGLDRLAEAGSPVEVRKCINDGSGPISPAIRIELRLRDGVDFDDVRKAAKAKLLQLGYDTVAVEGADLAAGERVLSNKRKGSLGVRRSASSGGELVISSILIPSEVC